MKGAIGPAAKRPAAASRAEPGVEWLRYAALAVICIGIWCAVYGRWSAEAWNVPVEYGLQSDVSDVKTDLAGIRAAQDGNIVPGAFHTEPRLNAPFVANWNDYPATEDFLFWGPGVLARFIGLYPAANFVVLLVQVLAALAFYYTARRLKCGWEWSFGGALLFALAPYAFAHSLHHLVITSYWNISPGLLVCFLVANGNGLRFRSRDYWLAIGVAVITGLSNFYYTSAFIQLLGISLIIQWMRHGWRQWRVCLVPLSIGTAAFATTALMLSRVFFYALLHGHNAGAVARSYAQLEYYGLKLVDVFIPFPTHKIRAFASLGQKYYLWTILPAEVPPACYFGLAVIAAFLWLVVHTVRNAIARPAKKIPLEAVQVLWLFLYAMVGGVNAFLGVMGFQLLRSTTRFCIVIFGISLLFAIRRLSLISKRWPAPWPTIAPLAIAVLALWEFLPPTAGENIGDVTEVVNSDRLFSESMEAVLPKGGMVFQLPVMDFPESPIPGISAYDHFRPYLYTRDLRFSFGTDKGRPENSWQRVIVGMKPADQIAALERYGFSGIYVNTAGYPDRGEALLNQYKAAGRNQMIQSPLKDLYCVVLKPSPNPELPPPGPLFAVGWYSEQDSPTGQRESVANGNAYVLLTNPTNAPVNKYANFFMASAVPRKVTIEGDGAYQTWRVDRGQAAKVTNLPLTLPPGESRLFFSTDAPATLGQMGLMTFDVVNFDLSDSPRPE